MSPKPKLLAIVGPTASGKSALAVELARKFGGEVISADSRQVYRGLDIGTGKITKKEMRGVPHHLLDVASPRRTFSAHDFQRLAKPTIDNLIARGKLPIVCGGTGFYLDALLGRVTVPDVAPDPSFRKSISTYAAAELFTQLQTIDPARAAALSSNSERSNRVRLIRALEIARAIGSSPQPKTRDPFDVLWIGLCPTDVALQKKITARLSYRLQHGMVAEAKRLHASGLSYKRMEALGLEYRSLARFLQKKISRSELEDELRTDIWRYARKQIGYWKRNTYIHWFTPIQTKNIERVVAQWMRG